MYIPYVIDNQSNRMADVLCEILAGHGSKSLDIATAYFNVRGFTLLQQGLQGLGSFRLLLGDEPQDGEVARIEEFVSRISWMVADMSAPSRGAAG
jgi:hypothetical protein